MKIKFSIFGLLFFIFSQPFGGKLENVNYSKFSSSHFNPFKSNSSENISKIILLIAEETEEDDKGNDEHENQYLLLSTSNFSPQLLFTNSRLFTFSSTREKLYYKSIFLIYRNLRI